MSRDLAIVGIGCRFPGGADSPASYWRLLEAGRDAVRPVPADRWGGATIDPDPRAPGRTYAPQAGFLDDPALSFDAAFFGISPREAETLDPQQRLLLEVAFEALEDAGVPLEEAQRRATGVFVGGFTLDSMILRFQDLDAVDAHTATSSSMTLLSNRISYALDLKGPSMTVDTACSSSLVAAHLAARALVDGECDLALAGGVNLMLLPNFPVVMCKGRFLAADGRSKAFDVDADGYGRGEGAGLVVLKRLDDALRDGDRIHAILRGTGVNQDGATDGIAQPSGEAQEALIRAVCSRFDVALDGVGYVEAHGTGTALGDPIEVGALGAVYGRPGDVDAPRLGSVKANIGHLEAAAGVAGLVKATLAVANRTIPPHRAPRRLNPALRLDEAGLVVPLVAEPWPVAGPAVAVVNSFGYGGTNAHAVVVEAPPVAPSAPTAPPTLLPVSARGLDALRVRAGQLADLLDAGAPLDAVASTLAHCRSALDTRVAVPVDGAVAALRAIAAGGAGPDEPGHGIVWVYSGMGPQGSRMGAGLRDRPAFRAGLGDALDALARHGVDVRAWADDPEAVDMRRNDVAQPCNFALQVALTRELWAHGARPDAIIGHSTGEMAAAWAAGALSLDDAARVVAVRARLQQTVAGGGMLAVGLAPEALAAHLVGIAGVVEVAAYNDPTSITVAGDRDALRALEERLTADGVFCKGVRVEVAYHSAHMDPIEAPMRAALAGLAPEAAAVPLFSTVTGARVTGAPHDAGYWWANTRGAVRLVDAVRAVRAEGFDTFVQIGPHPVLASALAGPGVRVRHLIRRDAPELPSLLAGLGAIWAAGGALDWATLAPRTAPIDLPAYPWQRKRYWRAPAALVAGPHPLLAVREDGPEAAWTTRIDGTPWRALHDHVVRGAPIVPGALWIEALRAADAGADGGGLIEDVVLHAALSLAEPGETQTLRAVAAEGRVKVYARTGRGAWTLHAEARRGVATRWAAPTAPARAEDLEPVDVPALYAALAARGLAYGPAFRAITALSRGARQVVATIGGDDPAGFVFAAPRLDAAFQALLALDADGARTMLPVGVTRLQVVRPPVPGPWTVIGAVREDDGERLVGDLSLSDADGVFAAVVGLTCRKLAVGGVPDAWWHTVGWEPAPAAGASGRVWRVPESGDPTGEDLVAAFLDQLDGPGPLHVVTREAWPVAGQAARNPAHAAVWGVARVAMTERPGLGVRLLDVDAEASDADVAAALGDDEEAALREGIRYRARLRRAGPANAARRAERETVPAGSVPARLVAEHPGRLDSLVWQRARRSSPGRGEVEVAIEAASLNFKDVMKALGLLDAVALEQTYLGTDLGMEAVGRVVRAGPGATLKPGARVLVYCGGALQTHLVVDERFVVPCPEAWTLEQAASFFVTATAWHALVDVGRIRAGDTLLVHSAAGGVGLAAVGIARAFGAKVIATAGTERKRDFLRRIGVPLVLDSRTLDFADQVRDWTDGRGVDLVLNALAGPAIERGIGCLAPGGKFLELGKKDLAADRALGLAAFNRRLQFSAIDLDRAATEDPAYFPPLARAVLAALVAGKIPHLPAVVYGADAPVAAFRALSGGDLVGKVVVAIAGDMAVAPATSATFTPRARRTWLVTGGLGGFGLAAAQWLAGHGVDTLVLAGRRGHATGEDARRVRALRAKATVIEVALDVSDPGAVRALVARIEASGAPLGGVFHAAAVLDDAPLGALTPASLRRVFDAKARGAWNLHQATLGFDLDGFVLCSSISAQVGNPGQGAYAAANTFLDGLACHRRALGLPATAVAWGALGDVGMVARDRGTEVHLRSVGLTPMPASLALDAFGRAVAEGHDRVGIVDIDWATWARSHAETPWARLDDVRGADGEVDEGLLATLAALPGPDRVAAAVDALVAVAAPVFGLVPADLDAKRSLREHGLDSLMAVELAANLHRSLRIDVSAMDLLGGRSLVAVAERLVAGLGAVAAAPPTDLRGRILVSKPYEAFDKLWEDGDFVRAELRVADAGEEGAVSAAELGRHLAILGSMAVARLNPAPGRHAHPVAAAELELVDVDGPQVTEVSCWARALSFDGIAGRGVAEAEMTDRAGRRLGRARVTFHVIPEAAFRGLFPARALPTPPVTHDPYATAPAARVVYAGSDRVETAVGPVAVDDCAGHFPGLPSMPVSILGRNVYQAVAQAARRIDGVAAPRVTRARLVTERLVWAGETARFIARRASDGWSCDVCVGDEVAARFVLELAPAEDLRMVAK